MIPSVTPPFRRASHAALLLAVVIPAMTLAWLAWTNVTEVNSWLFMEHGTSDHTAEWVERSAGVALVLACLSLLWRPTLVACGFIGLWFALVALAVEQLGGKAFSEITPLAHALRYSAPLALWLVVHGRPELGMGLVRYCLALTFAAHGYEALHAHPGFIDLLIPTARRWFGVALRESEARQALTVIGCMDLVLAGLLCIGRWRALVAYMGCWGLITLCSRMTAWGVEQWPESTIRLANAAVPLSLLFYWSATQPERVVRES